MMLKILLKQKAKENKDLESLIADFIKKNRDKNYKNLEDFLKSLRLFIWSRWERIDKEILKELTLKKLKELNISFETDDLDTIYEKMAVASSAAIGSKFVFDKIDLKSINAMKDMFYWTGTEYNKKTEDKLKDIIDRVFKGEIQRKEVAKVLEEEFDGVLKGSKAYFEGVADHIINQSQNVSRVTEAIKYGMEYFQVVARMDNKTSKICRSMNGRIIPAKHLERQVNKLLSAKSIQEKKDAAIWKNDYHFGKLEANFGLPPYHFRCRTMIQPVSVYEETIDGKKVRFSDKNKDDIITHIDNTGVQRRVKREFWSHSRSSEIRNVPKKDLISALNSIKEIAPHKDSYKRFIAKSANGYILIFEDDKVITGFKPDKNIDKYFKKFANIDKKEVIKWKNTILKYGKNTNGVLVEKLANKIKSLIKF